MLENRTGFWAIIRPFYHGLLRLLFPGGLKRTMNGTDTIFLAHTLHGIPNELEPGVWPIIMNELRPGDTVVEVGSFIGLYTVAMARRVGSAGMVYAFEPTREAGDYLRENIRLNKVVDRVQVCPYVVGREDGEVRFNAGKGSESSVVTNNEDQPDAQRTVMVRLDSFLEGQRVDLLKIDAEGYEIHILQGACELLEQHEHAPRMICIEVHPSVWSKHGVDGAMLLELLRRAGYEVYDTDGRRVAAIGDYGEIFAYRAGEYREWFKHEAQEKSPD